MRRQPKQQAPAIAIPNQRGSTDLGQHLRRVLQVERFEAANEVVFVSEKETGKTLRIIHDPVTQRVGAAE